MKARKASDQVFAQAAFRASDVSVSDPTFAIHARFATPGSGQVLAVVKLVSVVGYIVFAPRMPARAAVTLRSQWAARSLAAAKPFRLRS